MGATLGLDCNGLKPQTKFLLNGKLSANFESAYPQVIEGAQQSCLLSQGCTRCRWGDLNFSQLQKCSFQQISKSLALGETMRLFYTLDKLGVGTLKIA